MFICNKFRKFYCHGFLTVIKMNLEKLLSCGIVSVFHYDFIPGLRLVFFGGIVDLSSVIANVSVPASLI